MNRTLTPAGLTGTVSAIPSKSQAHRLLICAALGRTPAAIRCGSTSRDIDATAACLRGMGAKIVLKQGTFFVTPGESRAEARLLPCGESGSTLRFLLPVVGALGLNACFQMEGRLPQRPMGPLIEVLTKWGMEILQKDDQLFCRGRLTPGTYAIPGNISSQYLSGLLFALPLLSGNSRLEITTEMESRAYLDMTIDAMTRCGADIRERDGGFDVPGRQQLCLPEGAEVEGDWSNAAFFLCAGALSGPVTMTGLRMDSIQGDRKILDLLHQFGAVVEEGMGTITVSPGPLRGISIDASEIPDLVPVLAAVAAGAEGETVIHHAARLRLKESDRLSTVSQLLRALGGAVEELPDGLVIRGGGLTGGTVDACNDHRIAMTGAVCSLLCREPVTILGTECTDKSYPGFWTDFDLLRKER